MRVLRGKGVRGARSNCPSYFFLLSEATAPEGAKRLAPPEAATRLAPPEAATRLAPPEAATRLAPPERSPPPSRFRQAPDLRQHAAFHQADAEPGVAAVGRACGGAEVKTAAGEAIGLPAAATPAVRL